MMRWDFGLYRLVWCASKLMMTQTMATFLELVLVSQTSSQGEQRVCSTDNCWVLLLNPATGLSFS